MTKTTLSALAKANEKMTKAKRNETEEAPWREYGLRRLVEGEDAHELFKF